MPLESKDFDDLEQLEKELSELDESTLQDDGEGIKPEEPEAKIEETPKEPEKEPESDSEIDYAKEKSVPVDVLVSERKKFQAQFAEQQKQIDELKAAAPVEPEPEPEPEAPELTRYSDDEIEEMKDEYGDAFAERAVNERNVLVQQQETIASLQKQQADTQAERDRIALDESLKDTPLLRGWFQDFNSGKESPEFLAAHDWAKRAEARFPDKSEAEQYKWVEEQVKREFGITDDKPASRKEVEQPPIDSITDVPGGEVIHKKTSEREILDAINAGNLSKLSEEQIEKAEELLEREAEWH